MFRMSPPRSNLIVPTYSPNFVPGLYFPAFESFEVTINPLFVSEMSGGIENTQTTDALLGVKPLVVESLTELPDGETPRVEKPLDPFEFAPILSTIELSDNPPVPISITFQDPPLYEILSEILTFSSEEREFWWHTTAPLLNSLLQSAGYTSPLQRQYLSLLEEYIIPFLGPRPSVKSRWKSHLTPTFFPFEASSSSNSRTSDSSVRFRIEPVGHEANSPLDSFNQGAPDDIVSCLSRDKICTSLDWETFNYFADEFFIRDSDVEKLIEASELGDATTPSMVMQFDLDRTTFDPKMTAFFFPARKAQLTGRSPSKLTFDAVRRLHSADAELLFAMEMLENCFQSHEGDDIPRPVIESIEVDCTALARGAVTIYARTENSSFSHVRDIYTLSEGLNDRVTWSGLQVLEDLWSLMYSLRYQHLPTASWAEEEVLPPSRDADGGIRFSFGLRPRIDVPGIEIQIPVWGWESLGIEGVPAIQDFFESRGCEVLGYVAAFLVESWRRY